MDLFAVKISGALLILIISIAAGLFVFSQHTFSDKQTQIQQALARGIFFGLAIFHLIPDAMKATVGFPWSMLALAISFTLLLWLEHLGTRQGVVIVTFFALASHSFLMGGAMGLSPTLSTTLLILFAIVVHKGQESYALAHLLNQQGPSLSAKLYYSAFALMTPVGVLLTLWLKTELISHPMLTQCLVGSSAGAVLYLGTLHGYLPHDGHPAQCCDKRGFIGFVIGVTMILLSISL